MAETLTHEKYHGSLVLGAAEIPQGVILPVLELFFLHHQIDEDCLL